MGLILTIGRAVSIGEALRRAKSKPAPHHFWNGRVQPPGRVLVPNTSSRIELGDNPASQRGPQGTLDKDPGGLLGIRPKVKAGPNRGQADAKSSCTGPAGCPKAERNQFHWARVKNL